MTAQAVDHWDEGREQGPNPNLCQQFFLRGTIKTVDAHRGRRQVQARRSGVLRVVETKRKRARLPGSRKPDHAQLGRVAEYEIDRPECPRWPSLQPNSPLTRAAEFSPNISKAWDNLMLHKIFRK